MNHEVECGDDCETIRFSLKVLSTFQWERT